MKNAAMKRIAFYTLGLLIMTFGIALTAKADIGVASASTIAFAGASLTPLSFGQCSSLFHAFCFLSQIILARRVTFMIFFQIPLVYVFGLLLDIFSAILSIRPTSLILSCALVLVGTLIFSLGIRIILGSKLVLPPPDALVRTIGEKVGWPISKSKLIFDIVVVSTSATLTGVFLGKPFVAVGIGTIITMLLTGPLMGFYQKALPFFDLED